MVEYRKEILDSGLTVLTHEASDTPLATVNVLYGVGSRDERPDRTGFAHLFEHLMFGGTKRVPDFDRVVSSLGGECNAFTNTDYTNYYITLPADSLADALMLEADRMGGLELTEKKLHVQQKVVTEEYEQRYMGQPYGDAWLRLRPLCYKVHPYRWPTIGADIRHVSEAGLDDVVAFHRRWYRPENAVLAVVSPLKHDEVMRMVEGMEWRGESDGRGPEVGRRMAEPEQREARREVVKREVPADAVYLAWHMCGREAAQRFRACDMVSDLLGNGESSRLYRHLVLERGLLAEADACISGEADPGLLVVSGKGSEGVSADEVEEALREEVYGLVSEGPTADEVDKVLNRYENTFWFGQYRAADRALGLCYYTWLGDTDLVNREPEEYRRLSRDEVWDAAKEVIRPDGENVLRLER